MYRVLARTWRPQSFEELVGQQHVARALTNAIESDRLAHAYIFAGVRGIGKTTVARILAKCLNCEKGPTPTPCNECASCREITDGRSMDVLELDAASRRGINDVRELQEIVSYKAARDRYRILILDEFHMLTTQAFNALLKTLEEPPPQVIFVLATTEIQKILPTILSRCQVFEFRRVASSELSAHLRKVCDAEGVEISDHALDRIVWAGEGSVRDSLTVLERVLAFSGTAVSDEEALQVLGAVRHEVVEELVAGLAARDPARMLAVLDGLVAEGYDLVHFWGELVAALRDLILLRVDPSRSAQLSRTSEQAAALSSASEGLSREDLLRAFQIVSDLEPGLKASGQPRFLFEATLVRLAGLGSVKPIEELLSQFGTPQAAPTERPAARPKKKRAEPRSLAAEAPSSPAESPASAESPRPHSETVAAPPTPHGSVPTFFPEFVSAVHDAKPMLGAMLEEAASATLAGNRLQIRFKDAAGAMRKRLESSDSKAILEQLASKAAGRDITLAIGATQTAGTTARPAAPAPSEAPTEGRTEPPEARQDNPTERAGARRSPRGDGSEEPDTLLARAKSEPGIKKLLFEFGAEVVEIRPLDPPGNRTEEPR